MKEDVPATGCESANSGVLLIVSLPYQMVAECEFDFSLDVFLVFQKVGIII